MRSARFWIGRAGYGFLFGAAIASLEFAYYFPLMPAPDTSGLHAFVSLLLAWCGEGVLLALAVALAERCVSPGELRAWQLAAAVAVGVIAGVPIWSAVTHFVLRGQLGIALFVDHVGQTPVWTGQVLYHGWLMVFFGGLAAAVYASQRRRARMLCALRAAEIGRATSQQRLAQARLASLQARVEPDLLLRRLIELEQSYAADADAADLRLDELIAFLRGVLADIRASTMEDTRWNRTMPAES
jgi:hypothetical protein